VQRNFGGEIAGSVADQGGERAPFPLSAGTNFHFRPLSLRADSPGIVARRAKNFRAAPLREPEFHARQIIALIRITRMNAFKRR